jgi:hypothetical protein
MRKRCPNCEGQMSLWRILAIVTFFIVANVALNLMGFHR